MASTLHHIHADVKTILNVRIWISPDDIEEFFKYMKPAYDAVVAEPTCRYFVIGENPQSPGEIWWTEGWSEDVPWLMENQLQKEYYKPYLEATEKMFLKPRQFELLTQRAGYNCFKTPRE